MRSDTLSSVHPSLDGAADELQQWCDPIRGQIDQRLDQLTQPAQGSCPELTAAMRYSLLAPGKRVRPLLALLVADHFGENPDALIDFSCALELVHCASLILDDLPCMDDAQLRRGQAACHIEFGDATASLAAVALLNLASGVIARDQQIDTSIRCALIDQLSTAVGIGGLVSGQSRDLIERKHEISCEQMQRINHQKTGVLFELAIVGSGTLIGLDSTRLEALHAYALHLGQAFQAADDLLDASHRAKDSGKDCNADQNKGGSVHVLGESALQQRVKTELAITHAALPEGIKPHSGRLEQYLNRLFAGFG